MNDIGKELYERVRADFERRLAAEKHPPKDMRGVSDYSARVGRYLAEAIAANVTEDALPDRRLYYNIADSILSPSLRTNYELVNDTAAEVQRLLDERQGLRIKPARADYPEERVHAVIGAASEGGIEFDRALRRMTSPAENITQSFADDFMQANAEQRSKAGFDTFIERQGGLNCCPWCAGLVGVFAYPKGLPKEVFARHDNCTCSVTYGTKGGARQNAWTKAKWNAPPVQEPHRMTAEEAAEKGGFDKPKRLTGGANGGIIKAEGYAEDNFDRKLTLSTIAEDLRAVNPKYKRGTPYGDNCQRCVPTYYLRRKGYKVEALPTGINPQIDSQLYIQPHIFWERGGTPVVPIRTIGSKYFGKPEIIEAMRELPDGAMFEVFCKWKNRSGGHVFIAEKIDGKTHFIDPQIGDMDVSRYFSDMKLNQTTFWRIDNAQLREDMIPYCCKTVRGDDDDTK